MNVLEQGGHSGLGKGRGRELVWIWAWPRGVELISATSSFPGRVGAGGEENPSGLGVCDSGQGGKSRGRRKRKGGRRGLCPPVNRHVVRVMGGALPFPKLGS